MSRSGFAVAILFFLLCEVIPGKTNAGFSSRVRERFREPLCVPPDAEEQPRPCSKGTTYSYCLGERYVDVALYNQAASCFELFAMEHPDETLAPEALARAVTFYVQLNQSERAVIAATRFETLFSKKQPAKTASVYFRAGSVFLDLAKVNRDSSNWRIVRKYYQRYIDKYVFVGSVDEQIRAWTHIGDSYWNTTKPDFSNAEKAYQQAVIIFDDNAMDKVDNNERKADMINAAAKAKYQIALLKFIEFKKIPVPLFKREKRIPSIVQKWWDTVDLLQENIEPSFLEDERNCECFGYGGLGLRSGRSEEERRLKNDILENENDILKNEILKKGDIQFEYFLRKVLRNKSIEKKSVSLLRAIDAFSETAKMSVPEWEMMSAARAGDAFFEISNWIDSLREELASTGSEGKSDYYASTKNKYRNAAISAYERCLLVSTKTRWFNDTSKYCGDQLSKLAPRQYPSIGEIFVYPSNSASDSPSSVFVVPDTILKRSTVSKEPAPE